MTFKFTKQPSAVPGVNELLAPYATVDFINPANNRHVTVKALIDTGADTSLLNMQYAKLLGINPKTGTEGLTMGVEGKDPILVRYHNLEMEFPNFPNSKIVLLVAFINSRNVGALLGRYGFLDNFKLSFEMYNNSFEIKLKL